MPTILLDYKLDSTTVSNPDGSFELTLPDTKVVPGPGATVAGNFPDALDLESLGKGAVDVSGLAIDRRQFTLRIVFQANGPISKRANLLESNRLPFALFLAPRTSTEFDLVASVSPMVHGWRAASSKFATGLKPGVWYVADLVYDIDTVAVFVDEAIVSVHAFWWGEIEELSGHNLYVGTWVDGARDHFDGKIAAIQWWAGIPDALQEQLDERRTHPEWFITHKVETLRQRLDLGEPVTAISYKRGAGAYIQHYQGGALMYNDSVGAAFEMHGAIYDRYRAMGVTPPLGYLVSDESPSTNPAGRKSLFSKGAIYWSAATGAVPVLNQLYIDYEALGEARKFGFPTAPQRAIPGGLEQEFQSVRMYHKKGQPDAHEVHGAILAKFLSTGGTRTWGFPISNETDVRNDTQVIGKSSEFERCTIYWSSTTGAFEVHGDIRQKYRELKGPIGELGFPTSDEQDIFGVADGRFNTFQNAILLWYGNFNSIVIARPFRIFIDRINSQEDEGWGMGRNDMYIYVKLWDGAQLVYDQRHPRDDWGEQNIVEVDLTIPNLITPHPAKTVTFSVDVWEADPGPDDHLGTWTRELNAANGWGLRDNPSRVLHSGAFSKINSITASVHPDIDINSLSDTQKFWATGNPTTDDISYQQYASAFSDVDSDAELWDITDWLDRAFYELVVKDMADGGNCFGLSLEAIYSLKGRSLFAMPLNDFTAASWNVVEREVNIRHCYQVGAGPLWWFVGEFLTGNTHNPVDVFNNTYNEFKRGNNPVICVTQNYDFSGAPHCILPFNWHSNSNPWVIDIHDPNFPNATKKLTVNPVKNEFEYIGADTYRGGQWTGGRLHYMPYSLLSSRPRTPVWDAIMLILAGTVMILGDDAETESLTDTNGNDLDAHGNRARQLLQSGDTLSEFFVPFKGYQRSRQRPRVGSRVQPGRADTSRLVRHRGKGTVAGEILMRRRLEGMDHVVGPATVHVSELSHLPLEALTTNRGFRRIHNAVFGDRRPSGRDANRTLYQLAQDPKAMRKLTPEVRELVSTAASSASPGDFRHSIVGLRRGAFAYHVKHGLSEFRLDSPLASSERVELAVDRLGTSTNSVAVKTGRDKVMRLEIANKLGVTGDHVRIAVQQLAVSTAAPLQLNIRPGIGGLEVLTGGERVETRVEVNAIIDRKPIRRSFQLPIEGGARLKLSNMLSQRTLSVSRIDKLLAPGRDVKIITSSV